MILSPAQARAAHAAMQALNDTDGLMRCDFDGGDVVVQQHHTSGKVTVFRHALPPARSEHESYSGQDTFASAYGINDLPTANDIEARRVAAALRAQGLADTLRTIAKVGAPWPRRAT